MEETNIEESHKSLLTEVLCDHVLPSLKKPPITQIELDRLFSFSRFVYKVKTDQGGFLAKFPQADIELQLPHMMPTVRDILNDNNLWARQLFRDSRIEIEEVLNAVPLTDSETNTQDGRIRTLFPLAELAKVKLSEAQKQAMNTDKTWATLILENGIKERLLEAREVLKAEGCKYMKSQDIPKCISLIDSIEDENSYYNKLRRKFDSRKENLILSHNDFWHMNILKDNEDSEKLYLVDFEQSAFNPIGYDTAKMINVSIMVYDQEKGERVPNFEKMPSEEELREILKAFLILLGDKKIEETPTQFIQNLRNNVYDNDFDNERLDLIVKEYYELHYIVIYPVLFWCILKGVKGGFDYKIDDFTYNNFLQLEWALAK